MLSSQNLGGLWANVGQTTRDVSNRLQDDDYKRKAAGGKWKILFEQDVPDGFTDHQIHPFLKQHPGVSWDRESNNTEEFLFKGDPGDGSLARQIVDGILRKICLPLLQEESSKLRKEVERLQAELEQAGNTIRDLASGELNNTALMKIKELEGKNDTLSGGIRVAAERIGEIAREMEALRSELKDSRESELMMRRKLESAPRVFTPVVRPVPDFVEEPSSMWPALLVMGLVTGLLGIMVGRNNGSEWEETFKNHTPTSLLEAKGATEQRVKDLELQNQARLDRLADALVGLEEWRSQGLPQSKLQVYSDMYQTLGKDAADEYAKSETPVKAPQARRARRSPLEVTGVPAVDLVPVNELSPVFKDFGANAPIITAEGGVTPPGSPYLDQSYCWTLADALGFGSDNKIVCRIAKVLGATTINVKGRGIDECAMTAGRKIIFEAAGKHIIATCPYTDVEGRYIDNYKGIVTIIP